MAKLDDLTEQVEQLKRVLKQHGIQAEGPTPVEMKDRKDYIPHGSPAHARFLGLVEVGKDDPTVKLVTFTSPRTGKTYRLEDELGAVVHYPGIDPEKSIKLVLQQKVNELEIAPTVPEDAPPPFEPGIIYP